MADVTGDAPAEAVAPVTPSDGAPDATRPSRGTGTVDRDGRAVTVTSGSQQRGDASSASEGSRTAAAAAAAGEGKDGAAAAAADGAGPGGQADSETAQQRGGGGGGKKGKGGKGESKRKRQKRSKKKEKPPPEPQEGYNVCFLTTPHHPHGPIKDYLREVGFFVNDVMSDKEAQTILTEDPHVKALIIDISLSVNPVPATQLVKHLYTTVKRSVPVIVLSPSTTEVDNSVRVSDCLAQMARYGVSSLVEKPADPEQLAFRLRVLIDRYKVANAVYADVCQGQTKKLPLPRGLIKAGHEADDDGHGGGKGWKQLKQLERRRSSAAKRASLTAMDDDTVDASGASSMDVQHYNLHRAARVRRQRVSAPFEVARQEDELRAEREAAEEARRADEYIDPTDVDAIFAREAAMLKAAMAERDAITAAYGDDSGGMRVDVRGPSVLGFDDFNASIGAQWVASPGGGVTTPTTGTAATVVPTPTVGAATLPRLHAPRLGASVSAPSVGLDTAHAHMGTTMPAASRRTGGSGSVAGGGSQTLGGSASSSHTTPFAARFAQLEDSFGVTEALRRRRSMAAEKPTDIMREFGLASGGATGTKGRGGVARAAAAGDEKAAESSRRRGSNASNASALGSGSGSASGSASASASAAASHSRSRRAPVRLSYNTKPPPTHTELRTKRVIHERAQTRMRARQGVPFVPSKHIDPDIPSEEAWLVWMAYDVLHGRAVDPKTVHVTAHTKAGTMLTRALARLDDGDDHAAVDMYDKAVKAEPRLMLSYLLRGVCLTNMGRHVKAIADLDKYIEGHAKDTCALYNRAVSRSALGDHVGAAEDLSRALAATTKPPSYLYKARAVLYRRLGMFLEANKDLQSYTTNYPAEHAAEVAAMHDGEKADALTLERSRRRFEVPPEKAAAELELFLADAPEPDSEDSDVTSISSDGSEERLERRKEAAEAGLDTDLLGDGLEGYDQTSTGELEKDSSASGTDSDSEGDDDAKAIVSPRIADAAAVAEDPETVSRHLADILSNNTDVFTNVFTQATDVQVALKKRSSERTRWELRAVAHMLSALDFFRPMPPHLKLKFAKALRYKRYVQGEYVCKQGGAPDSFFICMSGELSVKVNVPSGSELTVNHMQAGDAFGQLAILFNSKRGASVVSKHISEVLSMTEKAFTRMGMREHFAQDLKDKEELILRSDVFSDLSPSQVRTMASLALPRAYKKGDVLVKQGAAPSDFFIIRKGICTVHKKHDVLADLELRINDLTRSLQRVRHTYVYHHDLHKAKKEAATRGTSSAPGAGPPALKAARTGLGSSAGSAISGLAGGRHGGAASRRNNGRSSGGGDGASAPADEGTKSRHIAPIGVQVGGAAAELKNPEASEGMQKRLALERQLATLTAKRDKIMSARVALNTTKFGVLRSAKSNQIEAQALISTLFPPAVCGEQAILNPTEGFAQGSVVADTYVEVLVLNKRQLETMTFSKGTRDALQEKSVRYPSNSLVYRQWSREKSWGNYKRRLMKTIPKRRWPVDKTKIRELAGGISYIVDD